VYDRGRMLHACALQMHGGCQRSASVPNARGFDINVSHDSEGNTATFESSMLVLSMPDNAQQCARQSSSLQCVAAVEY
jgi:hypothetical protein